MSSPHDADMVAMSIHPREICQSPAAKDRLDMKRSISKRGAAGLVVACGASRHALVKMY